MTQQQIIAAARAFVNVMSDPHPGLATWNGFAEDTFQTLKKQSSRTAYAKNPLVIRSTRTR